MYTMFRTCGSSTFNTASSSSSAPPPGYRIPVCRPENIRQSSSDEFGRWRFRGILRTEGKKKIDRTVAASLMDH